MNTSTTVVGARARAAGPAPTSAYSLSVPRGAQRALARGWLWLGLLALVGSGLFSILLVLSRTPGLNRWIDVAGFFRVALVSTSTCRCWSGSSLSPACCGA